MSPVWEANHVWLIFVLVVFWTGSDGVRDRDVDPLCALFIAAVGHHLPWRGVRGPRRGATIGEARALGATFALSSVIVPFFFGATVGADRHPRAGAGPVGGGDPIDNWTNLPSIYTGCSPSPPARTSPVFLAADAVGVPSRPTCAPSACAPWALAAVAADLPSAASSCSANFRAYDGLTSGVGLVIVAGSAVKAGLLKAAVLLLLGNFGPARLTSALAVGAIIVGLAVAQRPDLLPGVLTLNQAAAPATLVRCFRRRRRRGRGPDPLARLSLQADPAAPSTPSWLIVSADSPEEEPR